MGKSFGSRIVLRNASMWVYSGRITVLVGRNGQGKSTLIKTAIGLLRTDYGVVRYHQEQNLPSPFATATTKALSVSTRLSFKVVI